jgi:hypothetical protein
MNEDSGPPEAQVPTPSETIEPDTPEAKPSPAAARPPKWLPFFLLAVVPALVVGLAVYFLAGDDTGSGGDNGAGVLDGFFRLGPGSDSDVVSLKGTLPADFPKEFPVMSGFSVVGSFEIAADDGTTYFVVLSGGASKDDVYNYYLGILDKEPFQIEIARAGIDFVGLRFSRPDNPDIQGDVTIHHSDLDNKTIAYISLEDVSKKGGGTKAADAFVLPASRALPPGFPNDIAIYKSRSGQSIVTDTYFERRQGGRNFLITVLTKDSQDDVLKFYRDEFAKKGFTVTDGTSTSRFALSIDFNDGSKGEISGSVRTDQFDDDPSYNQIDLVLQVSGRRSSRGN